MSTDKYRLELLTLLRAVNQGTATVEERRLAVKHLEAKYGIKGGTV